MNHINTTILLSKFMARDCHRNCLDKILNKIKLKPCKMSLYVLLIAQNEINHYKNLWIIKTHTKNGLWSSILLEFHNFSPFFSICQNRVDSWIDSFCRYKCLRWLLHFILVSLSKHQHTNTLFVAQPFIFCIFCDH